MPRRCRMERTTKEAMTTIDHAVAQARELLAALDQQLLAATGRETDDARERVALLAFGLTALLEQLGTEPANDQGARVAPRPVMTFHQRFPAGPGRCLIVVRMCSRWFVIEGFAKGPLDRFGLARDEHGEEAGPFDNEVEAAGFAMQKSAEHTGIALWPMQKVVEA